MASMTIWAYYDRSGQLIRELVVDEVPGYVRQAVVQTGTAFAVYDAATGGYYLVMPAPELATQ